MASVVLLAHTGGSNSIASRQLFHRRKFCPVGECLMQLLSFYSGPSAPFALSPLPLHLLRQKARRNVRHVRPLRPICGMKKGGKEA